MISFLRIALPEDINGRSNALVLLHSTVASYGDGVRNFVDIKEKEGIK